MPSESVLPKAYNPNQVEEKWYAFWESKGYFHAPVDEPRPPYCITIPPPNVTGSLHMGHALQHAIHDLVVRWKRMQGFNVLCLPGTDHAGIATQFQVEKQIAQQGLTRYELGREKFLERVWAGKEEYGGIILNQHKLMGCSYDWRRERFTMDEHYARAVLTTFVELYKQGLIYRGHRVINWCPRCLTALSDLEVEHEDEVGSLWFIRYPAVDGEDGIVVATTRPETMLGDTAVAVNPKDERYKAWIGRKVILPLMNREIPVIADDAVSPEFGTGAVKVTPAHDANDFEIAQRHDLPFVEAMDEHGRMTPETGEFAGMERYECRKAVVEKLKQLGLLKKVEDYIVPLGRCYRCDTVIEPLLSVQWFVKMKSLAEPAIEVIRKGKVRYVPERFARYSIEWLEGIKDWCISRQIWWGHRIPVWYCRKCNSENVSLEKPDKCKYAGCDSKDFEQDEDVLDTWFSSAIWPHATLGWPDDSQDLKKFYPTDLMITDRQILYLWVARMIMTGLRFAGDIPFRTVFVHPTVLTREGKRMSKSLGTGIDPLDLMEKYGADALRFGLIVQCEVEQDIRFHEERLDMARDFANKLWNATRFVLMYLGDQLPETSDQLPETSDQAKAKSWSLVAGHWSPELLTLPDRWILSRLHRTIAEVNQRLEAYEFDKAAKAIYDFLWDEFCDWYVEITKPILAADKRQMTNDQIPMTKSQPANQPTSQPANCQPPATKLQTQQILCHVLETCLRLLHPFMPFVTEELWQQLPHEGESIMVQPYPKEDEQCLDDDAERQMNVLIELVRAIRNLKAEVGIPTAKVEAIMSAPADGERSLVEANLWWVLPLARLEKVSFLDGGAPRPQMALSASVDRIEVYVPLKGVVDIEKERGRLQKRLQDLERELERSRAKLNNPNFISRAPADIVENERQRLQDLTQEKDKLSQRLAQLQGLTSGA